MHDSALKQVGSGKVRNERPRLLGGVTLMAVADFHAQVATPIINILRGQENCVET